MFNLHILSACSIRNITAFFSTITLLLSTVFARTTDSCNIELMFSMCRSEGAIVRLFIDMLCVMLGPPWKKQAKHFAIIGMSDVCN